MARVNNMAETESVDNVAAKGLENPSQKSEKFGNIAVDSWKQMDQNSKDSAGKFGTANGKDGLTKDVLTKDGSALTFDDPFKKDGQDSSSLGKKMLGDDAIIMQKKKEAAVDDANIIQKKKELADSVKPGPKAEGDLDFSPAKPKIPADGGLKDKDVNGSEIISKKPLDGGSKDSEPSGKKPLDGGMKDPNFDKDFYLQKL